jgi:hypothetical protein
MQNRTAYLGLGVGAAVLLFCGLCVGVIGAFWHAYDTYRANNDRRQREEDLKNVWSAYQKYCHDHSRPPADCGDLRLAYYSIRSQGRLGEGSIVFQYGVLPEDMEGSGPGTTVLAYEKQVPAAGGFVLFGDGHLDYVEASRFVLLPLAKKKS